LTATLLPFASLNVLAFQTDRICTCYMRKIDVHDTAKYVDSRRPNDELTCTKAYKPVVGRWFAHRSESVEINLSRAAEDGVRSAVALAKAEQWKAKNADAIRSSNTYVETHGLSLDRYLQF